MCFLCKPRQLRATVASMRLETFLMVQIHRLVTLNLRVDINKVLETAS